MGKSSKKKGGILTKKNSITGSLRQPRSLKPRQTRFLIRRFHALQKTKTSILKALSKNYGVQNTDRELSENSYKTILGKLGSNVLCIYESAYNNFKISKYNEELQISDSIETDKLLAFLGTIDAEINQRGGIQMYQAASTQGQNKNRGGDSSERMVLWLKASNLKLAMSETSPTALEIGSLRPDNAISTCGLFKNVERIDLNSRHPSIKKQDFMKRLLPETDDEKFDLVSCSLVINFVPQANGRGEMLRRISYFLKEPNGSICSFLFLVLPSPCVNNSRYLDPTLLQDIMSSLGFSQVQTYEGKKVTYWLYKWHGKSFLKHKKFPKRIVRSGGARNNFCITL